MKQYIVKAYKQGKQVECLLQKANSADEAARIADYYLISNYDDVVIEYINS